MMDSREVPRVPVQLPPAAAGSGRGTALSPGALEDIPRIKLDQLCAGIIEWNFSTSVVGILEDAPDARYGSTVYRLPLINPDSPGIAVHLNVREAVLNRSKAGAGDLVRATGQVVPEFFQGKLSFRLRAITLEPEEPPEVLVGRRAEHGTLDVVRKLALDRHAFPAIVRRWR